MRLLCHLGIEQGMVQLSDIFMVNMGIRIGIRVLLCGLFMELIKLLHRIVCICAYAFTSRPLRSTAAHLHLHPLQGTRFPWTITNTIRIITWIPDPHVSIRPGASTTPLRHEPTTSWALGQC